MWKKKKTLSLTFMMSILAQKPLCSTFCVRPASCKYLTTIDVVGCYRGGLERRAGIEPASLAWKAKVLPLHKRRVSWSYSTLNPKVKEGEWCDLLFKKALGLQAG